MNNYSVDVFVEYSNEQVFEYNFFTKSESIQESIELALANIPSLSSEYEISELNLELQNNIELTEIVKLAGSKEYTKK